MSTILHRLANWADSDPKAIGQRYKENGVWKDITTREFSDRVFYLALFLESKGFTSEDIGVIFSYNTPEWVHLDLAPLLLGAKSAGLYPNSSHKDVDYILRNTNAKLLSVQNAEYFRKVVGKNSEHALPESIELIISFDGDTSFSPKAVAYQDAVEIGRKLAASKNQNDYLKKLDPGSGAFLIYTSGTTGNPKGALISHDNLVFASDVAMKQFQLPEGRGSMFSFLPLCHIAEKLQNIGVGITGRFTASFCSGFENIASELPEVQPILLLCVPRLWEKMQEGVQSKLNQATGTKKKLADWAFKMGQRAADARFGGEPMGLTELVQLKLADKLVLSKIRAKLGLTEVEASASGAALLAPHVEKWFRILGIDILNTYGQTESSGLITMACPGEDNSGTVGKPAPGTEFKLAEDGEILSKGRTVFIGYFKNDQATRDTVKDGWLYTGDLGVLNDRGQLVIRGRKKEIMKTSGGKMIAPVPIEEQVKESPVVSQVCMVGDGRKFFSALVTLTPEALEKLDASNGVIRDEKMLTQIRNQVDNVNQKLAGYEQIKKFTVLSREFSVDDGEMTPTLKMKRNIIEKNFQAVIDQMYS